MTCIAGIEHRGRVYLAGDSAVTCDDGRRLLGGPKVRRCGPRVVFGVAGDARVWAVAMGAPLPEYDGSGAVAWCRSTLAPALLAACEEVGLKRPDVELLVGVAGTLVVLDGLRPRDVSHTWAEGYGVIGDGGQAALGSLWSSRGQRPRDRLTAALEAASRYCSTVAPPFVTVVA